MLTVFLRNSAQNTYVSKWLPQIYWDKPARTSKRDHILQILLMSIIA